MINRGSRIVLCSILSLIVCFAAADSTKFTDGMRYLGEGKYKSLYGGNAIDSFKDAYRQTPFLGEKIAQALIKYSIKLAGEGNYISLIGENAHSVLNDALQFDGTTRDQVIGLHLKYIRNLFESREYSDAHEYCGYLKEYGEEKEVYKLIQFYDSMLTSSATNDDYKNLYECLNKAFGNDPKQKKPLIDLIAHRALNLYETEGASRSFKFAKAMCDFVDIKECDELIEQKYRTIYLKHVNGDNQKEGLKILDEIRFHYRDYFTQADERKFKSIIQETLDEYDGNYHDLYRNFQLILTLHYFDGLDFKFLTKDFDLDAEVTVFSELRSPEETAYFYYDTGRILSGSRGILITDENIYFKNVTGDPTKIPLNDIRTAALTYEKGVSLTGWKLRINDDENLDIRLSRIDDEAIIPFIASVLYLINLNNDFNEIELYIPEGEQQIIDGSIWERHKGVIVSAIAVTAAVTVVAVTQNTQQGQIAKTAVTQALNATKNKLAENYRRVNTVYKTARHSMKEEGRGFIKSFKTFEFKNKSGQIITGKLGDFYDKSKIVKMPYVGDTATNKSASSRGYLRDPKLFWKLYLQKDAEALSKNNLDRIAGNKSPVVDQQWISVYPNHKDFLGETLEHHHINHGGKAIPLPQSLHRIGTNHEKWHGPKDKEVSR